MALINAWYIKNPPWKAVDRNANNEGKLDVNWQSTEAMCRSALELRMRLIPYLHAAFVKYHREGLPPFRALVMDYPADTRTWSIDDQYMMGESVLVAPAFAGERERSVYLPPGDWYDFWTGQHQAGSQLLQVSPGIEQVPLFVRGGSILPLATVGMHAEDAAGWKLEARVYGPIPRRRCFTKTMEAGIRRWRRSAWNGTLRGGPGLWCPRRAALPPVT